MAKRQKLSLQQKRRVATKQKKQLKKAEHSEPVVNEQHLSDARTGIVISRFGEQVDVADHDQTIYRAYLRQNLGSCVSGDRVVFRVDNQNHGIVEAIEPRTSELNRPTTHSGIKTIVANVDQIFVVVAPYPDYSSLILDRYLIACELAGITTHIVFNKVDLFTDESQSLFEQQQALYQTIGYRTFAVSSKKGQGLDQLYSLMENNENIFVGQSGV
ncbi:MAG: ribosome small subunit-dependent GTPase A, partial [Kangiellaceae bacterium]|nr:ribosome small subunit-dependent GTPase A [Kangiellaceae bacterium]